MADATQVISAGHSADLALGWYIIIALWAILILTTLALLVDSLLPYRKRRVAKHAEILGQTREPLLMYTFASAIVIAVWGASMVPLSESYLYTMSIAAAFAAFFAIALIFTYLLRMVFPRVPNHKVTEFIAAQGGKVPPPADRHDVTVIDDAVEADDHPKGA